MHDWEDSGTRWGILRDWPINCAAGSRRPNLICPNIGSTVYGRRWQHTRPRRLRNFLRIMPRQRVLRCPAVHQFHQFRSLDALSMCQEVAHIPQPLSTPHQGPRCPGLLKGLGQSTDL